MTNDAIPKGGTVKAYALCLYGVLSLVLPAVLLADGEIPFVNKGDTV